MKNCETPKLSDSSYCPVGINGRTLEFKAFDLEGRLFDYMKIDKSTPTATAAPNETAAK